MRACCIHWFKIAVLAFCCLAGTLAVPAAVAQKSDRPNILYIMADDHAAHAISAYGSRINQTPNIAEHFRRVGERPAVAKAVADEARELQSAA